MRRILLPLLAFLYLSCSCLRADEAPTIADLVDADRLQVESEIQPAGGLVPGQQARLLITVATDRWFSGGTRISIPEVPGLVILQTEQFASNASETRNGENWVLQRWSLDVYPQRAGRFVIPPLALRLKVNAAPAVDVEGELSAPGVAFTVSLPPALEQVDQWVAAPAYRVSQRFDRPLTDLRVGDAFEREVIFEAIGVMAMMLPAFEEPPQEGLAAYPAPPALDNQNNRGESTARRSQRISYVVESPGEFLLPAQDYFWWDTGRGALKLLSLPEQRFNVGAGASTTDGQQGAVGRRWLPLVAVTAGLAFACLLLWWGRRRLPTAWLQRQRDRLTRLWRWLLDLGRPALPDRLNPGSNAGE